MCTYPQLDHHTHPYSTIHKEILMDDQMKRTWLRGSCIGRGAYGTVNIALHISTAYNFAVKSVDLTSAFPSQVLALENEIRILKSLSSPFIVKYLGDDTTTEGSLATSFRNLHMEYLPTGTLADLATGCYIHSNEASIASYTWCLVSALSYLHSRGIMHCDVKGKNVLLGPSTGSARLADFGSAAEISSAGVVSSRGSPLWMAPEVIRGEHQGPESDVWSLGCTVIEMVTGKPPWGAEAYSVYRIGYLVERPLFPAHLSTLAIDFLEKCLRRDYKKRWSCYQLLQHPFLSMRSQRNITSYSSPRSVLEWFGSDFHQEEEKEEDDDDDEEEEILNSGADERIRELVSGAGANWESEGWLMVRGPPEDREGTSSEYFDLREDRFGFGASSEYAAPTASMIYSNLNLESLPEEHNYGLINDVVVVALQHNETEHHNHINNIPSSGCSREKKLYQCNKFSFISNIFSFQPILESYLNYEL